MNTAITTHEQASRKLDDILDVLEAAEAKGETEQTRTLRQFLKTTIRNGWAAFWPESKEVQRDIASNFEKAQALVQAL